MLFVAFFPQLLAGPINRAKNLLPQFKEHLCVIALDFEIGLAQFGVGAVKKLVISDRIAPHVDLIFKTPGNYDGFTLLQGLLGYALQIYCDFSATRYMAIGAARMWDSGLWKTSDALQRREHHRILAALAHLSFQLVP
jgi:D-alanyl-lipoteichoic acid acyltransferase DltB (MBOAT superfamily)